MEMVKEFELAQVKAVRFKGKIGSLDDTDFVSFKAVKKIVANDFVTILRGTETKYIGMARIWLRGREIFADGLLDYQSPERLQLENGELALEYELSLGGPNDGVVMLDDDGKAAPDTVTVRSLKLSQRAPGNLQLKEMSWEF